jgi:hypothetical protein
MKLFAFVSDRGGGVIGLTVHPEGDNLPASFHPWTKVEEDAWFISETVSPEFTQAVERDGFYVMANGPGAPSPPVVVEVRRKKSSQ